MAKYDWKQLEKEYILSEYKSVKEFLRSKDIKSTGNTNKQTKGWAEKKATKEQQKSNKIVEKVIEKQSEKEANEIIQVKDVANDLLSKIVQANNELNKHLAKHKTKVKAVVYDKKTSKTSKEVITEQEEIKDYISIIDRKGLKELTSALKDINDILTNKNEEGNNGQSLAETIQKAYENKAGDK